METVCDTLVIGGGFAGLQAAKMCKDAGGNPIVLEARARVGGRALTHRFAMADLDMGCQWIGPGQLLIKSLASSFGFAVTPRPDEGQELFTVADYGGEGPGKSGYQPEPNFDFMEAAQAVGMLDGLAAQIDPENPAGHADASLLDRHSVASWATQNLTPSSALTVQRVVEGFLGLPEQISFLHTLFYARANGGFASMLGFGGERHDSEVLPEGLGRLASVFGSSLGDAVHYGEPVIAIEQKHDGVRVTARSGNRYRAKAAIIALPPALAARIEITPDVAPMRMAMQRRFTPFSRLKFHMIYPRPFWRDAGLSGQLSGGGFVAFDGSACEDSGVITGFFGAREALHIWQQPKRERARLAAARLALAFGDTAHQPIAYDDMFWLDQPYSLGCVAAPGPGVWTNFGAGLRGQEGRIFYAGSETSAIMPGQVEGALISGVNAAQAAFEIMKD